ncbi:uncharacterized protein N7477_002590 [Penicillium maclennaniae]|uniref:uncharacterized protein n=1 Tax=Penicillium maclennaniae TaxID=1343394 RepID=UPI00253F7EA0|nr:uncharacterized protein N7477_002590 [Penicillium maclennaniae]KAJ5676957.1 hypothetical protein N7477_002590 [Penicillium maclennaniae]
MKSAGPEYTRSSVQPVFPSWILYGISLFILGLFLAVHYIRRRHQAHFVYLDELDLWSPSCAMEKALIKSHSSPSACDILIPLSRNGTFPSSGAVAAMAREQMQNADACSPGASKAEIPTQDEQSDSEASGSVQRRESAQQMQEADTSGVRTWRRLIVEYS